MRFSAPILLLSVLCVTASAASDAAEPKRSELVHCLLCGDYMFPETLATKAEWKGHTLYLCSINELDELNRNPDKYLFAIDPVSGSKVNRLETGFTHDYYVRVKKRSTGKVEVWPRRFYFESADTRAKFIEDPSAHLDEPIAVH